MNTLVAVKLALSLSWCYISFRCWNNSYDKTYYYYTVNMQYQIIILVFSIVQTFTCSAQIVSEFDSLNS